MPDTFDAAIARQFLHRLHAVASAQGVDAVAALGCEYVVWQDPAAPQTLHGRDAALHCQQDIVILALLDARVEPVDGFCPALDGSAVTARLRKIAIVDIGHKRLEPQRHVEERAAR